MALWGFTSRNQSAPVATPAQPDRAARDRDDRVELRTATTQRRTAYRTSVAPADVPLLRFWIHEPGTRFRVDQKGEPITSVLDLDSGIVPVNISSSGLLVQVALAPDIKLPRIARQDIHDPDKRAAPFRDASCIAQLLHKGERLDVLVTGRIVRTALMRTTQRFNVYEIAIKFHRWGAVTDTNIVWYRLADGGVPPIVAWISQYQLRHAELERKMQF